MLHVSDLKRYNRCPRLYYLNQIIKPKYFRYLRSDENIYALINQKYNIKEAFLGKVGDSNEAFLSNRENYEWFIRPRFEYQGLRVNIPYLRKKKDKYDVYFLSLTVAPKTDMLFEMAADMFVLRNLGIDTGKVKVIYLNPDYVRKKKIDPKSLFKESEYFLKPQNDLTKNKIKKLIDGYKADYLSMISDIEMHELDDFSATKNKNCTRFGKCTMYDACFGQEIIPDNSILNLIGGSNKEYQILKGNDTLAKADLTVSEGNALQYAQIMADRNGGLYFDKIALKEWMKRLSVRPLIFMDFEWEHFLIPPYKQMKPFDVLCFEYSVHILDKKEKLIHKEYLGTEDCREDFIKKLLKDIPKQGAIVAYNAFGAESYRLLELATQFPKYGEELKGLVDRLVDLQYPFANGLIYDIRQRGNYSLKSLLPIVSDYSYSDLNINQGLEAVLRWRLIDEGNDDNREESEVELKQYCGLDTYSMYLVYKWLCTIID